MSSSEMASCPLCQSPLGDPYIRIGGVPTLDGAVGETREQALACATGDVEINLCTHCGWVGNSAFVPGIIDYEKYHFSLQHSSVFEGFVADLVDRLTETHRLGGGKVLDVGCGSGDFLRTFAERSGISGLGVDPSIVAGEEVHGQGQVRFERGILEDRHTDFGADLICCRHVLNSMPAPVAFLKAVRAAAGDRADSRFYFEVPHADRTFDDDIVWNLAYEHHNWFNELSFRVLCERAGFEILDMGPCWRGEYLGATLRSAEGIADSRGAAEAIEAQRLNLERFANSVSSYADLWNRRLAALSAEGKRVAIWGAGARALLFLCQLEHTGLIGRVVDINPNRQGNYLTRVGTEIHAPEELIDYSPDLLLISNAAFADEIREQAAAMGIRAETEVF